MDYSWINLTNPVSIWWLFLVAASLVNILAWSWTRVYLYRHHSIFNFKFYKLIPDNLIWFSLIYVLGCAYRSYFVKADVQRICVFDTWLSSVMLGRTVATIAELSFVAQWAIVIRYLAIAVKDETVKKFSYFIVPLIIIAECFSWFAVTTTNYLGNTIEESLWTLTYSLLAIALIKIRRKFVGAFKYAINLSIIMNILYVLFMIFVDVSMYFHRFKEDLANGKKHFGLIDGLHDLNTHWVVTYDINVWRTEIPWMSLYFSFAVLVSIALCYVPLDYARLKKHIRL